MIQLSKKILSAAALSLSLSFAVIPAQAQEFAPAGHPVGFVGHHHKMGLQHVLHFLDLSQAQNDKIFEIRHKNEPTFYKNREKARAIHEQIDDLRMNQNFDTAKARALYTQLAEVEVDIKTAKFAQEAEIYNVLTAEQKAELKKLCDAAHQNTPMRRGKRR